jgi:hypothetical protein
VPRRVESEVARGLLKRHVFHRTRYCIHAETCRAAAVPNGLGGKPSGVRRPGGVARRTAPTPSINLTSMLLRTVVLDRRSRCTSTPLPAHTPVRHRRHTDERSDCKAIPFLTSHVHGHVLHSNGWLVVSPRPPPYAASACPPARSQSHVMFHHSARVDEATISKSPRPSGSACYSATIYRIVTYAHKHEPQCIECHLRIVLHNKGESLRSVAGCCASRTRCSLLPQAQASSSASYSEKKLAISASCSIEPTRSSPRCGMTTGAGPPMPGSLREFQLSGRVAEQ